MNSLQEKINHSIELMRKFEGIALEFDERGYWLAFSGGKDSQVLYHLAVIAGVKFRAVMNITTIDPPELLRFIRKNYPNVEFIRPQINFYELIKKKKMLPLQHVRYCCSYFKEQTGANTATLIGIRRDESIRRSKRNEIEISNNKYSASIDQFNRDAKDIHACIKGKDKLLISPIFNWTEKDVWHFIKNIIKVPYCNLYDDGYKRIGCVFCPMASKKTKKLDRLKFPGIEKKIKQSIQYLIENNGYGKKFNANVNDLFDWWISNESASIYFAKKRQLEIKFI